jgi:hypothetical protein
MTTLRYQKIEDRVEVIGLPKEKLCLYCWRGDYKIPRRVRGSRGQGSEETVKVKRESIQDIST